MLPPLSSHAHNLSFYFQDTQEMIDVYASGSLYLDWREKEALCASVISAIFHYPNFLFNVSGYFPFPDKCSRLLYAFLYAEPSVLSEAGRVWAQETIKNLELQLDENFYDLFPGGISYPHLMTEESQRAHLKSAMCVGDILKFVPGLFLKEPNMREPLASKIPFARTKKTGRKRFAKSFFFLNCAQ